MLHLYLNTPMIYGTELCGIPKNALDRIISVFTEAANKVLSGCVTSREVDSEQYKMVYEVDYLFLEECDGHQQYYFDEFGDADSKHKDDIEASPQEQSYNDSSWVESIATFHLRILWHYFVIALSLYRVVQYKVTRWEIYSFTVHNYVLKVENFIRLVIVEHYYNT